MRGTASLSQAVLRNTLVVNGPVFLLLFALLGLFAVLVHAGLVSREYNWVGVFAFLVSFIAAWIWWSISVPRWRVWVYERVPSRTEIKSVPVRRRKRELDVHTETSRGDEGHDRLGQQ
jgi:hypothetical protein